MAGEQLRCVGRRVRRLSPAAPLLLLCLLPSHFGSSFRPSLFPFRRRPRTPSTAPTSPIATTLNSQSTADLDYAHDYSGGALSGAWNLEFDIEGTAQRNMVSLMPNGKFSTPFSEEKEDPPPPSISVVDGAWSVDPDTQEFTVAVYGVAKNVKFWFVGNIDAGGSMVSGVVGEGAQDPAWVGKFTLTKFMAAFDPTVEDPNSAAKRKAAAVTYRHDDLVGTWRVETFKYVKERKSKSKKRRRPNVYKGETEASIRNEEKSELVTSQVFDMEFFSNSTWQSINGFENGRLAGRWNVFSEKIDLGTGIKGKGTRVWFQARRFSMQGGRLSYGVNMTHDMLFMGPISFSLDNFAISSGDEDESGDASADGDADAAAGFASSLGSSLAGRAGDGDPMKVRLKCSSGYICHGFSGEPVFTGRFNMSRLPTGLPNINLE